jgi:hypothetical protein
MKATITRASNFEKGPKDVFVVSGVVTDGEYAGVEFEVWHHAYYETDGQRTSNEIFARDCPVNDEEWGTDDLEIPCNVKREVVKGDDGVMYVDWSFMTAATSSTNAIARLKGAATAPATAPTATRRKR